MTVVSPTEYGDHILSKPSDHEEKQNGQTVVSDDLSALAPLVGLEPTTP